VARGPGAGAYQMLPQGDGDAEGGDTKAVPRAPAHSGRRRGRSDADIHPRGRLLHSPAGKGGGGRYQSVPERRPSGRLLGAGPLNPQHRRSHEARPHHPGGLQVAPVGDGGGSAGPPEVRFAGDPVLPQGGREEGSQDRSGGGGQEAANGVLVGPQEPEALLQPCSRSGVAVSSWLRCPASGVVVCAIEGAWGRSHSAPMSGRIGACYIPRGEQPRLRREELNKSFT